MSITIELSPDEIKQIKQLTNATNEAEAVSKAAREYLRLVRLRESKSVSGKVDFKSQGEALERSELDEVCESLHRIRHEVAQQHGVVDFVVPALREDRDR